MNTLKNNSELKKLRAELRDTNALLGMAEKAVSNFPSVQNQDKVTRLLQSRDDLQAEIDKAE